MNITRTISEKYKEKQIHIQILKNQLEISREVVICLNGFTAMEPSIFPCLQCIQLLILLSMHSIRH